MEGTFEGRVLSGRWCDLGNSCLASAAHATQQLCQWRQRRWRDYCGGVGGLRPRLAFFRRRHVGCARCRFRLAHASELDKLLDVYEGSDMRLQDELDLAPD